MVKSKFEPKWNYNEKREIEEDELTEDKDYTPYYCSLFNVKITFILGNKKRVVSGENIFFYFPVFLIVNEIPRVHIGVFEIKQDIDDNADIDPYQGNLRLFHFVNKDFIGSFYNEVDIENQEKEEEKKEKRIEPEMTEKEEEKDEEKDEEKEKDETDEILEINKSAIKQTDTQRELDEKLQEGFFETEPSVVPPKELEEESNEDSEKIKSDYEDGTRSLWINRFMKNNHYDIVDNEGRGDCFFAVIRDAYSEIGRKVKIDTLRAIVAREINQTTFDNYKEIYDIFFGQLKTIEEEMKKIKKRIGGMKEMYDKKKYDAKSIGMGKILEDTKKMSNDYKELQLRKKDMEELMEEFQFMKNINSLEDLQRHIQTSNFWADTNTVSILERVLNIKIIVLSEEKYSENELNGVLQCGQLNDDHLEKEGNFKPEFYIIVNYSGNHYKLITYKKRRIFKFREIPYDIKALIINKCLEKDSGPYWLINDFRELKSKLGIPADEGAPLDMGDEISNADIYDTDVVFAFHSHSSCKRKAGRGTGERILETRLSEFSELNKSMNNVCNDWRKKLDDTWNTRFTLDNLEWDTVEHYTLGCQYKKTFPDFFMRFANATKNSKEKHFEKLEEARGAASKSGKYDKKVLREKNIKPDEGYSYDEARKKALEAKFTQNLDLKKILLETKMAMLVHYNGPGTQYTEDMSLMVLRRQLQLSQ
jgi:predicted NAD-dependent protein-ADP-ribosyltransferase YbiA (DUF1768 family)